MEASISQVNAPPPAGTTGLYHAAIRYPDRAALGIYALYVLLREDGKKLFVEGLRAEG